MGLWRVAIDGALLENRDTGFAGVCSAFSVRPQYQRPTKPQQATAVVILLFVSYAFGEVAFTRRVYN